ncbi:glycosyltransferase involved in cell wall biosynthesis [Motilibacter peucedani]|uniref:Glycosyltransferase involved in cell wall biosynthesis n=1 Tax=Motilibacter peucedani TaxID=598650 RepID=A0A420XVL1_9ACTN|nr:glycosyltransferase [Motilibacter peucedani]RKS80699.1 glycosyltransferase involved in cell wall biosynthesis [Motilibacter peucedani]
MSPGAPARPASVAILSTYPPTQCGLATFSAALYAHLAPLSSRLGVVRVVDAPEGRPGPEVVGHLVNGSARSAARAVDLLDSYDAVLVQHEYGIYGGPDGSDVLEVLGALTVPVVSVLHTVLEEPSVRQRHILLRLLEISAVVVTMTQTARDRLLSRYGADPARVVVIPHGAADTGRAVRSAGSSERPLVLTWGLLGPGKGIEWAVDAVAGLRDLDVRYLVAGKTHPKVLERDGESYRDGLRARVRERGVTGHVEFDDSYLDLESLARLVRSADVVLLPYDSVDQVTSGVLIEAVAAGRPVVSTAFPHATELLSDGPGLVVPQRDAAALEAALRRVLTEPGLAAAMSASAVRKAPELLWGAVAQRYQSVADTLVAAAVAAA